MVWNELKHRMIPLWGVGLGDLGSGEGGDFSPQVLSCFTIVDRFQDFNLQQSIIRKKVIV